MHDAPASDWLSIAATVASVLLVLPIALAHAAWAWWRETDRATRARALTVDAALSVLGVLGALALGAAVSGHPVGGCTAAALLRLQPLSLMLAPTEEPTTAMTGTTLCGMALVVTGARRRPRWPWPSGGCILRVRRG